MTSIFAALGEIGAVSAVFVALDALSKPEHKAAVSDFMFGRRNTDRKVFETAMIVAILSPFIKDFKLRKRRVLWISFLVPFAYITALAFSGVMDIDVPFWVVLTGVPTAAAIAAAFAYPFDLYSVWLTKRLFFDAVPIFPKSLVYFAIDVVLSLAPVFLVMGMIAYGSTVTPLLMEDGGATIWTYVFFGSITNGMSSVALSALQAGVFVLGFGLRGLAILTRANAWLADNSRAREFPFTVIGVVAGLLSVIVTAAS